MRRSKSSTVSLQPNRIRSPLILTADPHIRKYTQRPCPDADGLNDSVRTVSLSPENRDGSAQPVTGFHSPFAQPLPARPVALPVTEDRPHTPERAMEATIPQAAPEGNSQGMSVIDVS